MKNEIEEMLVCREPSAVPIVMKPKYPASLMALSVISSDGDVMLSYFFLKTQRQNSDVKPNGIPYVF